jgi:hypothetical protein
LESLPREMAARDLPHVMLVAPFREGGVRKNKMLLAGVCQRPNFEYLFSAQGDQR